MKRIIIFVALLMPLLASGQVGSGPPGGGDPGGNPDVPISGIAWLVLSGGILGAKMIYQKYKKGSGRL